MRNESTGCATFSVRLLVALAIAIITLPASLRAEDKAQSEANQPWDYKRLVDEGLREFSVNNYEEARSLFLRAHALDPNARTHRALGLAEFELRNYRDSVLHLREALHSRIKPLSDQLRRETETVLERAYGFVARVRVALRPMSAGLIIDGEPVMSHADDVLLSIGEHKLQATSDGYVEQQKIVNVKGGEKLNLTFMLARNEPVAGGTTTSGGLNGSESDTKRWYKNPWLWTGVGLVIAGAAGGAIYALTRDDNSPRVYGGSSGAVISGP